MKKFVKAILFLFALSSIAYAEDDGMSVLNKKRAEIEKAEKAKVFEKGDLIHIFGYFKKREKEGKTYKNFVVKSYNKIEKKEENEEE